MTTTISTAHGPIKAIHIQVPVGIPTPDGGLEIPNRVFLGGIPTETTELELEIFFSDFGVVKDVRIVTDRVTGECKGYGFVTFEEQEDIGGLLKKKSIMMKGKKLRVRKAIRRNGSQFHNSSDESSSPDHSPISGEIFTSEPSYFAPFQQPATYVASSQFTQQQQMSSYPHPCTIPQHGQAFPSAMPYPIAPNFHPVFYYPIMNPPAHVTHVPMPMYHQI